MIDASGDYAVNVPCIVLRARVKRSITLFAISPSTFKLIYGGDKIRSELYFNYCLLLPQNGIVQL